MELTVHEQANYSVYRIYGSIMLRTIPHISPRINNHIYSEYSKHLVFDLSNVKYLDSSGLNFLRASHMQMKESGKRVYFLNPAPNVRELMDNTGFDTDTSIIESCDEIECGHVLEP